MGGSVKNLMHIKEYRSKYFPISFIPLEDYRQYKGRDVAEVLEATSVDSLCKTLCKRYQLPNEKRH